jgi:nucleoid DNA-binding protein
MEQLIKETASRLGLSVELVDKIIRTYMEYVRMRLTKIRYSSLDSFEKVRTNFSLPGFGKLVVKQNKKQI